MTTVIKRSSALFLVIVIFFLSVGYAAMTDVLQVIGIISSDKYIDYLYALYASVDEGTVTYNDGDPDVTKPAGIVGLNLTFDSADDVKTLTVNLKNNSGVTLYAKAVTVTADNAPDVTFTTEVSGLEFGKLGIYDDDSELQEDPNGVYVVGGTAIEKMGGTLNSISVKIKASAPCTTNLIVRLEFGYQGKEDVISNSVYDAAKELEKTLNNHEDKTITYDELVKAMDQGTWYGSYIGNVAGGNSTDDAVIDQVFGETLKKVILEEGAREGSCSVMINGDSIDDGRVYMFMTIEDLTLYDAGNWWQNSGRNNSVTVTVYAVAFDLTKGANGEAIWTLHGEIYQGKCNPNLYSGTGDKCNSFDSGTWRSEATTDSKHTSAKGTKYDLVDGKTIMQVIDDYHDKL